MSIQEKYEQYRNVRLQTQRKYLSYDLWKQEYATNVDLQSERFEILDVHPESEATNDKKIYT